MSYSVSKATPPSNEIVVKTSNRAGEGAPTLPLASPSQAAPEGSQAVLEAPALEEAPKAPDPRMAELERKERLLAQERRKLAAEKAAFEAARQPAPQTDPNKLTAEEWRARFMEDPSKLGIDVNDVATKVFQQPSEERQLISKLEAELAELKGTITQSQESVTKAQEQAYQNAVAQLSADTKRLITSRPQDFEMIGAEGAHDDVVELIKRTYQEENVLLSVEDAAQSVEEYLTGRAVRLAGLSKVKAKIAPEHPAPEAPGHQATKTPPSQQTHTTLTRNLQGSTPNKPQSARERAIAAFNARAKAS